MSLDDPGTSAAADPARAEGAPEDAALDAVLAEVPKGALALSGLTVGLLMLAWLAIYLFVFLPRGMVG
ncbi:MAG TPA: hypothetical protein VF559_10810 [Caulobacteraceae bacterium]|jgi:hypothetical protein